jgi:hypothetical protein
MVVQWFDSIARRILIGGLLMGDPLFDGPTPTQCLFKEEVRAARKEKTPRLLLAMHQYELLGTQNTQKVIQYAMTLSVVGCMLILMVHKRIHPDCLRILRQNNPELHQELADRLFFYAM